MSHHVPDPQTIRAAVQELVADVLKRKKSKFKLEDVKEGVSLTRDLGIDSLDILQMTAVFEKKHKVTIPDEETKNLDELGSIVKTVTKYWPHE
ncbi:MAG: acyl carrier protein [Elusimicrobia bacterium]|nr:acyl carrier protein [Elusimicrobiota bacterium]